MSEPTITVLHNSTCSTSRHALEVADYTTPDQVAELLVEHPRLMERPVLVRGDRAIIGRPRDRVAPFLA